MANHKVVQHAGKEREERVVFMKKVTLEYCKGGNEGRAIYLNTTETDDDSGGGHRVAGGKCWGFIQTIEAFELSINDLEDIIRESKLCIKELKNNG